MAKSVVSAQQLAMFMTPREIASTHELSDSHHYGGVRQMMDVKQRENELSGLDKAIQEQPIQKPFHIFHQSQSEGGKSELVDGHHRLVAGLKYRPDDLVPVRHADDADVKRRFPFGKPSSDNDWADRKGVALDESKWD
jgi:hypothetical protein